MTRAGDTLTVVCAICSGLGHIGDDDMTPCPAGCEPCWNCQGTKLVEVSPLCSEFSCCGGYCPIVMGPCDEC